MSAQRIHIDATTPTAEAKILEKKLSALGYEVVVRVRKVYTITADEEDLERVARALTNTVVEQYSINEGFQEEFTYALELGFLPGVTDNVGNTARTLIADLLHKDIEVYSSTVLFLTGNIHKKDVESIAQALINVLIQRYHIKDYDTYVKDNGMDTVIPEVHLSGNNAVVEVDLEVDDEALTRIGKEGILDPETGERRGPLALDLDYMKAIQAYFAQAGRKATDIELESIAQTWSEHCKHTLFAAQIDEIEEGLFKRFIKGATEEIRAQLGENDFCASVFTDNSGAIDFDDDYLITDKVETHNTPSTLDPFGGSITGIVGVNRDTIGFGLGAMPLINRYGFCIGKPEDQKALYRGKDKANKALSPKRMLDGIIEGVNVGGNCSGIPTTQGFLFFDDSYKGKPGVFVGTIGLLPKQLPSGTLSYEKQAQPGDHIVIIGGRVGKDGIHGATFSSEAMDSGSPATAVQIGDPITQKKLSDAVVKEARDQGLYHSITDNGAGGLSCSVAEMAKEAGGFMVDLEKVKAKYPGMHPWEIWISESQERMTLAVSEDQLTSFLSLMEKRGVEASVIGTFTDTGRAVVRQEGKTLLDLDMDFLHEGLPKRILQTAAYPYQKEDPHIMVDDQAHLFFQLLGSHNLSSYAFVSEQYDHEVQGGSVVKPLQGKGKVNGNATVVRPLLERKKGVVISQALFPRLSEIDCHAMALATIDAAIRNCVAVGGNIKHLALLDNFCWCSSQEPQRLLQLKEATQGCYEGAVAFSTPFISGKDTMYNDFKGYDEDNDPVKISVLPTLLISSIGVIEDVEKTCTMDFKMSGDLIYVLGETKDECGGSAFYDVFGQIGGTAPEVDVQEARRLYEHVYQLHQQELLSSCHSVGIGGIGIGLALMSIAGKLGMTIDLSTLEDLSVERLLYSESASRFIVTIDPVHKDMFEQMMQGFCCKLIGVVRADKQVTIAHEYETIISTDVQEMNKTYKERFKGW